MDRFFPGSVQALPNIAPDDTRHDDWTASGTAFDYRLRLLLAHQSAEGDRGVSEELSEALDLVDLRLVDDIAALAGPAVRTQRLWLSAGTVVSNPTFEAPGLRGGADADLIVDGTLIEVTTTKTATLSKTVIHQVLGYLLADT